MDTVGFGLCLRADNGEIIDSHPGVDASDLAAAGLFDLLAEQNAGLTAFHNRLTIGSGLRDDVVVVALDPSGNGARGRIVFLGGCLDFHLAAFLDFGRCRSVGFGRLGRFDRLHRLNGIVHIRQFAVLRPGASVVAGLLTDVADSGDLNLVVPLRSAFDRKTVTDIYADVAFHPNSLAGNDAAEVRGNTAADLDHAVGTDVGNTVDGITGTAVGLVLIAAPSPQDTLDEADAVEAEGIGCCGIDHCRSRRLLIVGVVRGVAFLVCGIHRRAEAPHHIEGLIVGCHSFEPLYELRTCHYSCHIIYPPFRLCRGAAPEQISVLQESASRDVPRSQ